MGGQQSKCVACCGDKDESGHVKGALDGGVWHVDHTPDKLAWYCQQGQQGVVTDCNPGEL